MRVGLISCCAKKLGRAAPARELYRSPLFQAARDWIAKPGRVDAWAILSAKHGLVIPDTVIEPYDVCLADMPAADRRAWAIRTEAQIVNAFGLDPIYLVVLGEHYKGALARLPFVEDVIGSWTRERKDRGVRYPMTIGVLKKLLSEGKGFGS